MLFCLLCKVSSMCHGRQFTEVNLYQNPRKTEEMFEDAKGELITQIGVLA